MNETSPTLVVDLGSLGLDDGGTVLLGLALRGVAPGSCVRVVGTREELAIHGAAWCRARGHRLLTSAGPGLAFVVGTADRARWQHARRAGHASRERDGAIARQADPQWGLAARGALVEAGVAPLAFALSDLDELWTDDVPQLYAQAAAAQWDPNTAIPWDCPLTHPGVVEDAIVQIMTYLVENETAALLVPARFLAQIHPHFREVMQLIAIQCADEARHIEVFTRRACLHSQELGTSSAGGQASLRTLVEEPDFAVAMFLLSVLGEGSFLALLWFLHEYAPDEATRAVCRLAAQDEARHVAFGLGHLARHLGMDPGLRPRLIAAVERRHDALAHTAGLNADVFDALVLVAAGEVAPAEIARGWAAVVELEREMDRGRRRRLARLGFDEDSARALSELHTKNFM